MKKLLRFILICILFLILINLYMILVTQKNILNKDALSLENVDCILVLGAGIRNNGPSPMLEDRLLAAIELYQDGVAKKILVSGDHENSNYDEVNVMKNYLIDSGIPSEDIFMDHLGLSSYDSIYRLKKIFKANRVVIVTQRYHLYRSIYIAKNFDIDAYGVSATKRTYSNQIKRDIREFAARIKDFFKCIYKPSSTYLGEVTPIKGDGNRTNKD